MVDGWLVDGWLVDDRWMILFRSHPGTCTGVCTFHSGVS